MSKIEGKIRKKIKIKKRAPISVGKDAILVLNADGLRKLLSMELSRKAMNLIQDNIGSKTEDRLKRFRLNAPKLVENSEANRAGNINQATPQELKMKVILKELGVKYEFQKVYFTGMTYYIVDFYLPEYNVILELDGSQHHDKDGKEYDKLRTENLTHIHRIDKVIRFDNKEVEVDSDVKKKLITTLRLN
jgi:very-short-patch-repair endonuclease